MLSSFYETHQSNTLLNFLYTLKKNNIIRPLDYYFANYLFQLSPQPLLALIGALVSYESSLGNACLNLDTLTKQSLFGLSAKQNNQILALIDPPITQWTKILARCSPVGQGGSTTPLVLYANRIYLHRYWVYETAIINWLKKQTYSLNNKEILQPIIQRLFPEKSTETNWQKIAASLAASTSFTLISGGPGTGKTTTVTRIMALLLELSTNQHKPLSIELTAPTGKAAARLSESVRTACETVNTPSHIKRLIPKKASTLHRLLGANAQNTYYKHNHQNPLHMDVLIVDEASMIDLTLMARLIISLPIKTQLILLGDKNQLASVEAGSVLGDISSFASTHYHPNMIKFIEGISCEKIKHTTSNHPSKNGLHNHICLLQKSFRFKHDSGIGMLAQAINTGDLQQISKLWEASLNDIAFHSHSNYLINKELLSLAIQGYKPYLTLLSKKEDPDKILAAFNEFQFLCAVRSGTYGVEAINHLIYTSLAKTKKIKASGQTWYPGRPIMITKNDHALELFNGDIGIAIPDDVDKLRVAFIRPDGDVRMLLPARLPSHETVFAMTVHKSQGSEFNHTVFVMPDAMSPALTRELVYTAVTRAKKRLTLFGDQQLLLSAIKRPTQRHSGLIERINITKTVL